MAHTRRSHAGGVGGLCGPHQRHCIHRSILHWQARRRWRLPCRCAERILYHSISRLAGSLLGSARVGHRGRHPLRRHPDHALFLRSQRVVFAIPAGGLQSEEGERLSLGPPRPGPFHLALQLLGSPSLQRPHPTGSPPCAQPRHHL